MMSALTYGRSKWPCLVARMFVILAAILCIPREASSQSTIGTGTIELVGLGVDVDTRPDLEGIQYTMSALRDVPSAVHTIVGAADVDASSNFPAGTLVKASVAGPGFGSQVITITTQPNEPFQLPIFRTAGDYTLYNVRLEDPQGNVIMHRDASLPPVQIQVISEILMTQVTTRPLTLDEIEALGIEIDEDNFQVLNFAFGLTLGSQTVPINLPVVVPLDFTRPEGARQALEIMQLGGARFETYGIPNLSLMGFQMRGLPDDELELPMLPRISGVIVIPGNIAYLNQFFSVFVQTSNLAPVGSGLSILNARARIVLPPGGDQLLGSGDDPLRIATTQTGGQQSELPLVDSNGSSTLPPQGTNGAQFLVEGLRQGTHNVDFEITGDLTVPGRPNTYRLTGRAAGVVQVENPTFDIVLAHPQVVRDGEEYSIFATVTNTSDQPANLFTLRLKSNSLSGTHFAPGEAESRTIRTLAARDTVTVEYRLISEETGAVSGTVFQADDGITGSFIMTAGVGDTGIPLSPDTLVLPQEALKLPREPNLVWSTVRLLGQAHSVATAPANALPPNIQRISGTFMRERGSWLGQVGTHLQFGDTVPRVVQEIVMDYFGNDLPRVTTIYAGTQNDPGRPDRYATDIRAFDVLRRAADAGNDLTDVFAEALAPEVTLKTLPVFQREWAEDYASRPSHLSFGARSRGPPLRMIVTDGTGRVTGLAAGQSNVRRDVAFADYFQFPASQDRLLLIGALDSPNYRFDAVAEGAGNIDFSLVVPRGADLVQVLFEDVQVTAGSRVRLAWAGSAATQYQLDIDSNGDGSFESHRTGNVQVIEDRAPSVVMAQQWGKFQMPLKHTVQQIQYRAGEALGRLVGVLFDEEVGEEQAERLANYAVSGNLVVRATLQPDRRLVFLNIAKPVGPFVAVSVNARNVDDQRAQPMVESSSPIVIDPEQGDGGTLTGQVFTASGVTVPYATVDYIQPVMVCGRMLCEVHMLGVSKLTADAAGRFSLDFVLQNVLGAFELRALDPQSGEMASISAEVHFDGQRMVMNLIQRGLATLEGDVFEEDGRRVTRVLGTGEQPGSMSTLRVRAMNLSTGEEWVSWVDENGHYSFPRRFVDVSGNVTDVPRLGVGNISLQLVRPSDRHVALSTINIPASGSEVRQDLVLRPPGQFGRVTVRVLEPDGTTPASSVFVEVAASALMRIDSSGQRMFIDDFRSGVIAVARTDENGLVNFENVPVGEFVIQAGRKNTGQSARANSHLETAESETVNLVLPGPGGTVRGILRDALGNIVANASIAAGPYLVTTDANGRFEVRNLPRGRVTVYGRGNDSPALGSQQIETNGPDDLQEIVITLEPIGNIEGVLYEADRVTPVASQKVQLWVEPGGGSGGGLIADTMTDAAGHFLFQRYPVRSYTVRAITPDQGDGGIAVTAIRFAGDHRTIQMYFRGRGSQVIGRVIQDNGTPAMADTILIHKTWSISRLSDSRPPNPYLEFVQALAGAGGEIGDAVQQMLNGPDFAFLEAEFFVLTDVIKTGRSGILGPNGEVTGNFAFTGGIAPGPFTVGAISGFLAPAEVSGSIPVTTDPAQRIVNVGDLVLQAATSSIRGRVFMPDGITPVGAGVRVSYQAQSDSGDALGGLGGSVLPAYSVVTNENGEYEFPLTLRGSFSVKADSGVAPAAIRARSPAEMRTDAFQDVNGNRILNVRIYGMAYGVAPQGGEAVVDIRLQDAGAVRVRVIADDGAATPVPQAEVTLTTTSEQDVDEQAEFVRLLTDADGYVTIFPVTEGAGALMAHRAGFPLEGRANFEMPRDPANGHVLEATVTMGAATSAGGVVTRVEFFGTITGLVTDQAGAPIVNPTKITVNARGVQILATTGTDGRFIAEYVPNGLASVEAFEPYTARTGTVSVAIESAGQVVDITIPLNGVGTVTGRVLSNDGQQPVTDADVILRTTNRFTREVSTRTDTNGTFRIPGVPTGAYQLEAVDVATRLRGSARGVMTTNGALVTTDVYMQPSGRIRGIVYAAGVRLNAAGQPVDVNGNVITNAPTVANAEISAWDQGRRFERQARSDAAGVYDLGDGVPLTEYALRVASTTLPEGTHSEVTLTYDGQIAEHPVVLDGTGRIEGVVLDAGGAPAPLVEVTLRSRSDFMTGPRTRITTTDGGFAFDTIPVGDFSLTLRTTAAQVPLGGGVSDRIGSHGAVVPFRDDDSDATRTALRIQAAGSVFGVVRRPDGSVAAGTVVTLRKGVLPAVLSVSQIVDAAGAFRFDGMPLGQYAVSVLDEDVNGVAGRSAALVSNEQQIDLGVIVVDATAPRVISTVPASDANGVHGAAPISVTFTEPIAPGSLNADTLRVTIDGIVVDGTRTLSADGLTATFTPTAPLPDLKAVLIRVKGDKLGFEGEVLEPGVKDLEGIGVAGDYAFGFITGDTTPPTLVSLTPATGSVDVPLESVIRIELNEAIAAASAQSFELRDGGGNLVTGQFTAQPILGGRVFVFQPTVRLAPNTGYTARLRGPLTDLVGNPMPQAELTTSFESLDSMPPQLLGLAPASPGGFISGRTVTMLANIGSQTDIRSVDFYVNGVLVHTAAAAPFGHGLYLNPAFGSSVVLGAVAEDFSGNRSTFVTAQIPISVNQPPSISLAADVTTGILPGSTVVLRVTAADDIGLRQLNVVAGGVAPVTINLAGETSVTRNVPIVVPTNLPFGASLVVRAAAEDTLLAVGVAGDLSLTIGDVTAPGVTFGSPAGATRVNPGEDMTVLIRAEDISGVSRIELAASGALTFTGARDFSAANPAIASFTVPVPSGISSLVPIVLNAAAIDAAGNRGERVLQVTAADRLGPAVSVNTMSGSNLVGAGTTVELRVAASDASGIASLSFQASHGIPAQTRTLANSTQVLEVFQIAIPAALPPDTLVEVFATVTDSDGNSTTSVVLTLRVADTTAPTVSVLEPAQGGTVASGQTMRVVVRAADSVALSSVGVVLSNALIETRSVAIDEGTQQVEQVFEFELPGTLVPGSVLRIAAFATDRSGNRADTGTTSVTITDGLPPAVDEIFPADAATNVPRDTSIIIRFTEPLLPASIVPGVVTLTEVAGGVQVAGTLALSNDGLTVVFNPALLQTGVAYAVRVQGVRDLIGNPMAGVFESGFTAGSATDSTRPTIVRTSIFNGESGVPLNARLSIEFSERMDPATLTPANVFIRITSTSTALPATLQLDAEGRRVTLAPLAPLAPSVNYQLVISGLLIADLAGNTIVSGSNITFSTGTVLDTTAPRVQAITPPDGVDGVPTNARLIVLFDEAIDPVSVSAIGLSQGGAPVATSVALSDGNRRVQLSVAGTLLPSTAYLLTVGPTVRDLAGNLIGEPAATQFQTGTAADTLPPNALTWIPDSNAVDVPRNIILETRFSERLSPVDLEELLRLTDLTLNRAVPGLVTLSADGLTVRFAPLAALDAGRQYRRNSLARDLAGNLRSNGIDFTTSTLVDAQPPQVVAATIVDGAQIAVTNPRVSLRFGEALDARCVNSNSLQVLDVTGTPIAGVVSLSADGRTLSFTPSQVLAAGAQYTVRISGLCDIAGNIMPSAQTAFGTTAGAIADTTRPAIVTTVPANAATAVPVTTTLIATFGEPIDVTSVDADSFRVFTSGITNIAGSYSVAGNVVTFTPAAPLPGGQQINWQINTSVRDLAGNTSFIVSRNFTTAVVVDSAPPQVLAVSPADLSTGIGVTNPVVLTLSEPLSAGTVNATSFALYSGAQKLSTNVSRSLDGQSVVLTGTWPANSLIQVVATPDAEDLAGNALLDFLSEFSTGPTPDSTRPSIASMRPGNGAASVGRQQRVVLFATKSLNASTIPGALQVAQNGVLIQGSVSLRDNGRTIEFTPAQPWAADAMIEVFATTGARDLQGNSLNAFQASFRVAQDAANMPPALLALSSGTALNSVIEALYSEPLDPSTITPASVRLLRNNCFGVPVAASITLEQGNRVIRAVPVAPLDAQSSYSLCASRDVRDLQGQQLVGALMHNFSTGTGLDLRAPVVQSMSPGQGFINVPTNTRISLVFDEPINPISVNQASIQLGTGSGAPVAADMSFSDDNRRLFVTPHGPLAGGTTYAVSASGITDTSGNSVTPASATFTTATEPDTDRPIALNTSPEPGETDVPINSVIHVQLDEPVDPATMPTQNVLYDQVLSYQPVTISVSADGRTVTLVGVGAMAVNRTYQVFQLNQIRDLAGNTLSISSLSFRTSVHSDTVSPAVSAISPSDGTVSVSVNTPVVVRFSEPIRASTANGAVLVANGTPVAVDRVLSDGNRVLTLVPRQLLVGSTVHAVELAQVRDLAGNLLTPVTTTFTTGVGADFAAPVLLSTAPSGNAVNVPRNIVIELAYNERLRPPVFDASMFVVRDTTNNRVIAGTITISADARGLRFTPAAQLEAGRRYQVTASVRDLAGNVRSSNSFFDTGVTADTEPPLLASATLPDGAEISISNPRISFRFIEPVDSRCVNASSVGVAIAGVPVAGTVTLNADGDTLSFTPSQPLPANSAYVVSLQGLCDMAGNVIPNYSSTFRTLAVLTADLAGPTVSVTTPANGLANVSVNTTLSALFNEAIDVTSVHASSFRVFTSGLGTIPGTHSVSGNQVIFTPALPLPGGVRIDWQLTNQIRDRAGNGLTAVSRNFTTAAAVDNTAPYVVAVSPADLSSNIGITNPVTVTLSEALQSSSVNANSFALYANGARLSSTISRSDDGRVVTLTGEWPADSLVQLVATPAARDFAGNGLLDFLSEFRTTNAADIGAPSIASQRPASGATDVPTGTNIVLYAREPMLPSSLQAAVQVSENGVLLPGDVSVRMDGRTIEFTPSRPWMPGALIEIVVTSAARDLAGNALNRYEGSFRAAHIPDAVAAANNGYNITNSLNGFFELSFTKALDAATVNATTVGIRQGGYFSGQPAVPVTISLHRDGRVIRIVPNAPLAQNTYYEGFATTAVRDVNGIPLTTVARQGFTTLTFQDSGPPVLVATLPVDADVDVPVNGRIGLQFNESMNVLSIHAGTVVLRAAAGQVVQLGSISFSDENRRAYLTPHEPLAPGATYTVTIEGVMDPPGNVMPTRVLTFQSATTPDTEGGTSLGIDMGPANESVPVNAVIQVLTSEPVDPTSVQTINNVLYDNTANQYIPVTASVGVGGHVVTLVAPLAVNHDYTLFSSSLQLRDRAGNNFSASTVGFRTGSAVDSASPQVLRVTPVSGLSGVPTNAKVVIDFNEPIRFNGITNVSLQGPSGVVGLTRVLTNGNRTLTLTPQRLLAPNALHTLNIQGVSDLAGNLVTAQAPVSFTTAVNGDFSSPEVTSSVPGANATGVGRNVTIQWSWNERISAASVSESGVTLRDNSNNQLLAVAPSLSADGRTLTMTPQALLESNRQYRATATVQDLAGNSVSSTYVFTTGLSIGAQQDSHHWRFESANFLADSIGAMTLTAVSAPAPRPHSTGAGRMFPDPLPFGLVNRQAALMSGQSRFTSSLPTSLTGAFTIEAFVVLSLASEGIGKVIAAVGDPSAPDSLQGYSWALETRRDAGFLPHELVFAAVDQDGSTLAFAAARCGLVLDPGVDYYVAAAFDPAGTVTFWVRDLTNGGPMRKVTVPHTINLPSRQGLVIGHDIFGSGDWGIFGLVDEVRLTRRLLADSELLAANLIRDGSFERPILAPASFQAFSPINTDLAWRVTTNAVDVFSQGMQGMTAALYDGVQALDLVSFGTTGGLEQTFFASAGVTYRLRFAYSNNPLSTTTASAAVSVRTAGGTELLSGSVTHNTATLTNLDWRTFDGQFIGTGSNVTLGLTNTVGAANGGVLLDGVSVAPVSTQPAAQLTP